MEVYAAVYDAHGEEVRPVRAEVIDEGSFHEYLCQRPVIFAGTGAEKCKSVIRSANAVFLDHVFPDAQAMLPLAEAAFARQDFVDTAYFEPLYLKEFQATVARNRLLI
jgi:tRNA threonylcarbamoyladenosine biosynthesis protein TsaB